MYLSSVTLSIGIFRQRKSYEIPPPGRGFPPKVTHICRKRLGGGLARN
jgi:hypothetical protein